MKVMGGMYGKEGFKWVRDKVRSEGYNGHFLKIKTKVDRLSRTDVANVGPEVLGTSIQLGLAS